KDFAGAMRSARRLGDDEVTIVKACAGAEVNATKVAASLDAVAGEVRQDVGYTLCRIRWLRRHDDVAPTKLMLAAPGGAQQRLVHERRDEVRQNLGGVIAKIGVIVIQGHFELSCGDLAGIRPTRVLA